MERAAKRFRVHTAGADVVTVAGKRRIGTVRAFAKAPSLTARSRSDHKLW
ncbi:MAG: hypothetical protein WKF30_10100 [Pyrinomonadaceae bacterium]